MNRTRYECYVMFDPATGDIIQSGRGIAHPRDGFAVAEIVGTDHREVTARKYRVDLTSLVDRLHSIPVATLIEI